MQETITQKGTLGVGSAGIGKVDDGIALNGHLSAYIHGHSPYPGNGRIVGDYTLTEDNESDTGNCVGADPTGWISTTANTISITVGTEALTDQNFGDFHGVKASGTVFNDRGDGSAASVDANNAVYDTGTESGIADVTVQACADSACNTVIESAVTEADGGYTLYIPHAYDTQTVYLKETDPTDYISTGSRADTVQKSNFANTTDERNTISFTAGSGSTLTNYNFGDVKQTTIRYDQSVSTSAGGSLSLYHTIRTFTPGILAVSLASTEGLAYSVYTDAGCDTEPDAVVTPTAGYSVLNSGTALAAGVYCIVVRGILPTNTAAGTVDKLTVTALLDWVNTTANNGDTGTAYDDTTSNQDVITVTAGAQGLLRLIKQVRNVTQGETDFSYSNTGEPCDILEYKITFKNRSAKVLKDVLIADVYPDNTALETGAFSGGAEVSVTFKGSTYYGHTDQDPDGVDTTSDSIKVDIATLTGTSTIQAGEEGTFLYRVQIDAADCP